MIPIPEQDRLDFVEFISQAENDCRTTGMFLLLVAPRDDNFARESVLTAGDLPTQAILDRVIKLCLDTLENHNEHGGQRHA